MDPKHPPLQIAACGVGLELSGGLMTAFFPIDLVRELSPGLIAVGLVVLFLGCARLAKAKGLGWHYGLLSLLSFVGLAILWFLIADKKPAPAAS